MPFLLLVGLFFLLGFTPLLFIMSKSFFVAQHFSFANYQAVFDSSYRVTLFEHSLLLSLLVTLLTLLLGLSFGILFAKTDLVFKKLFLSLFTLPLLLPPSSTAFAFSHLFGTWFFGFWGVVFMQVILYLPLTLLSTFLLLTTINPQLESAARVMMPRLRVLTTISLPLIFPSLLFMSTLVFLLSFGDYSIVNFLHYPTFVYNVFVEFSAFYHYNLSFALSFVLLFFILALLYFEHKFIQKREYKNVSTPFAMQTKNPIYLGRYKLPLMLFLFVLLFFISIFPLLLLLFDVKHFSTFLKAFALAQDSLIRSLLYATVGTLSITFFGFVLAYSVHTKLFARSYLIDTFALVLFALPSTLVGIALLLFFNHSWSNFIYTSPLLLLIAYTLKYSALSSRIFLAQLKQIPDSMQNAAKVLGINHLYRLFTITLPLVKNASLLSGILSFILLLRDTDITMLLINPGKETLTLKTLTLMANSPSELISALHIIMIAFIIIPLTLLSLRIHK